MNAAVLCAGATVFLWYAFGALPLHLSVVEELGLDPARASSWISIVWMSSAVTSIAISLRYRQPIPITWTIPSLVLLGAVGGNFSAPELAGACLAAGVALLVLGMAGAGADALERSFGGEMKFGALVALAVAATPFTVLGVGPALWALLCGLAASAAAERTQLTAFWKAA
ncbi:MAG TPA: benzoate/H(+) symporter BenE family transporter [Burkholderiales bacterium]|nr:benzoate/H(+) symporter BenE family transporter [Burkholderiales bacterium]